MKVKGEMVTSGLCPMNSGWAQMLVITSPVTDIVPGDVVDFARSSSSMLDTTKGELVTGVGGSLWPLRYA